MANWKMIASFVSGAVVGGGLTFIFTKTHMEREKIAEINAYRMSIVTASKRIQAKKEEIKEQEEILSETESENKVVEKPEESEKKAPDTGKEMFMQKELDQYVNYTAQYDSESDTVAQKAMSDMKKASKKHISGPYNIDPDDYGAIMEYDQIHLTYYSDGVLADDDGNTIEHYKLQETVGNDFKDYFGEYSEDAAWFRNDDAKCEYEVERSMEPYYGG